MGCRMIAQYKTHACGSMAVFVEKKFGFWHPEEHGVVIELWVSQNSWLLCQNNREYRLNYSMITFRIGNLTDDGIIKLSCLSGDGYPIIKGWFVLGCTVSIITLAYGQAHLHQHWQLVINTMGIWIQCLALWQATTSTVYYYNQGIWLVWLIETCIYIYMHIYTLCSTSLRILNKPITKISRTIIRYQPPLTTIYHYKPSCNT